LAAEVLDFTPIECFLGGCDISTIETAGEDSGISFPRDAELTFSVLGSGFEEEDGGFGRCVGEAVG
jgi:hypothetical protein